MRHNWPGSLDRVPCCRPAEWWPSRTAAGESGTAKPWGPGRARAKHPHGATFPRAHGVQATHPAAAPGAAPAGGALAGRAWRSAIPVRLRPSLFAGGAGGATGAPSVLRRVTVGGGFTPARRQGSRLGLARGGEDGNPRALAGRKSDWCPHFDVFRDSGHIFNRVVLFLITLLQITIICLGNYITSNQTMPHGEPNTQRLLKGLTVNLVHHTSIS
jgi:hypothetical protein